MSKAKGQQAKTEPSIVPVFNEDGMQSKYLLGVDSSPQWWGVKDDKGQWAFGGGMVCHYPCEAVAKAHAESLSPRWKAVAFE